MSSSYNFGPPYIEIHDAGWALIAVGLFFVVGVPLLIWLN